MTEPTRSPAATTRPALGAERELPSTPAGALKPAPTPALTQAPVPTPEPTMAPEPTPTPPAPARATATTAEITTSPGENEPNERKKFRTNQHCQIRDVNSCEAMDAGMRRRRNLGSFFSNLKSGSFRNGSSSFRGSSQHSYDQSIHSVDLEAGEAKEDESIRLRTVNEQGHRAEIGGNNGIFHDHSSTRPVHLIGTSTRFIENRPPETQYRLIKKQKNNRGLLAFSGAYEDPEGKSTICPFPDCAPDRFGTNYIHWAFRSPFIFVFFSAAVNFFGMTLLFALVYWIIGQKYPDCIGGINFGTSRGPYTDAFILSWTTFSTVGYGLIYPQVSSDYSYIRQCTGITIITTLESFVGILFASVFGAIMIAKVGRVQSYAQIMFSDPILVRFGPGVKAEQQNYSSSEESGGESLDGSSLSLEIDNIPCPILEFRIVNRLNSMQGGEIIDATMNIVTSVDVRQVTPDLRDGGKSKRRKGKKGKKRGPSRPNGRHRATDDDVGDPEQRLKHRKESIRSLLIDQNTQMNAAAFEEEPSGRLIPKRVFTKLEVESADHPFFKRVWNVRHIVDDQSPLVKPQVRQLIRENNGFWPSELNNYEGIRASIKFDQILVSFSGTSNADANSVYAQHVYHYINMNVGYRFVNLLYRDSHDGSICIDTTLINDVTEQAGGGAEPFNEYLEEMENDMLVL